MEKSTTDTIKRLFVEHNIPLLHLICRDLRQRVTEKNNLLFMARDTCLLFKLWKRLYPEVKAEYIYANRELFRYGSDEYFREYLNPKLGTDTILVDLASSCSSLVAAMNRGDIETVNLYTAMFLDSRGIDTVDINLACLVTELETCVDNIGIEALNYDTQPHACDLVNGEWIFDEHDAYDTELISELHAMFDEASPVLDNWNPVDIERRATLHLKAIDQQKAAIARAFPKHMRNEWYKLKRQTTCGTKVHVVSSTVGYQWETIKPWVWSLETTGFQGETHVFQYDKNAMLSAMLKKHGVNVHRCEPQDDWQIVVYRFEDLADWCETLPADEWVVACDISDIVFQRDPAEWLSTVPKRYDIVIQSECISFQDQHWAGPNMQQSFPHHWRDMRGKLLYNAGSFAARAGVLSRLAREVYAMCLAMPNARNHDQAALNILLQSDRYRHRTKFANASEGWCYCCASTTFAKREELPHIVEPLANFVDGKCIAPGGKLPCLFHHYNRNPELQRVVFETVHNDYQRWKVFQRSLKCAS